MELKLRILFASETDFELLIVPYGIETYQNELKKAEKANF